MTPLTHRAAALLFTLIAACVAAAQQGDLATAIAPLEKRQAALNELLATSPARFVEESLALADAYAVVAKRYAAVPQSAGVRGESVTIMTRAAAAARTRLKKPQQAIEIYRRAGTMHAEQFPGAGAIAFGEEIADIQQFDLGDGAAAVATLKALRTAYTPFIERDQELGVWYHWKTQWLDAEVAYLESGKAFSGEIDTRTLAGFMPQLYYGAGREAMGSMTDPALNIFNPAAVPAAELEAKLLALPPSHSTFLQTWIFATRLPNAGSVRKWLARNDPGGFWAASLLTLAAIGDRDFTEADSGGEGNVMEMLIRGEEGQPTPVALLAREYAKSHKLPPPVARRP